MVAYRSYLRVIARVAALGLVVVGVGCRAPAPVDRRAQAWEGGRQGQSWDAVLPGVVEGVDEYEGHGLYRTVDARRDVALGAYAAASPYPLDMWPAEPLPRLERARRVFIDDSDRRVIYFQPASPRWR